MKLAQPYKCDYCHNVKTASNHWFLSIGDGLEFRLIPWDDTEADRGSVRHVCSESCAVKSLNKYFEGRSEQLVASVPEPQIYAAPPEDFRGIEVGLAPDCTLGSGHKAPCNGIPRETCPVFNRLELDDEMPF